MTICADVKAKLFANSDNTFRRKTLERTYELLDSTVARITYQVKMIRHYHVSNELAWPLLIQTAEFFKESTTTSGFCKDRCPLQEVSSDESAVRLGDSDLTTCEPFSNVLLGN